MDLPLPPIGGYILTGQLCRQPRAHAPVILRHDLTTDFFGIEEREAGCPDFRSFNVFPISVAALARLRGLIGNDPRFEIDTRHSAFGWIPLPKAYSAQLELPVQQPPLFATREEHAVFHPRRPAPALSVGSQIKGSAMAHIFAFVKFFKEEAHADAFMKGDLYMNRLSYFQSLEDSADAARPDRYEATAVWLQPEALQITFSEHPELNITGKDLAAPVSMAFNYHTHLHLFCMSALMMDDPATYGPIERADAEDRVRRSAQLDPRCCSDFGEHAVIVSATPFFERFKEKARASGKKVISRLVDYYDEKTFDGSFKFDEIPFKKQMTYSYQKEFRICIDSNNPGSDALHFNIGDISSFCAKLPSSQVNTAFQINVSDNKDDV